MRVTAPHFCAGIVFDAEGGVLEAAPILAWAKGKSAKWLKAYFDKKGWKAERVASEP